MTLGKKESDLTSAEKKQVRILLKDDSEGQARDVMSAWGTILNQKQQLDKERSLMRTLYERLLEDNCVCNMGSSKVIANLIRESLATHDELSETS